MSVTLSGSILSTSSTTGSTLPTPVTAFTWSNFPSTLDTCTSAMLSWQYTGTPETLQFTLVSNASPHTLATTSSKRAGNSTTLATDIDAAAMSWNWTQVNFDAGRYVMEAYGTDVSVTSPTFTITYGADTSCLTAAGISAAPNLVTPSPEPPATPTTPTTSVPSRKTTTNVGVISGGILGGVTVLILAFVAYRGWTRRRRRQPKGSRESIDVTRGEAPSLSVTLRTRALLPVEKEVDWAHPLHNLTAELLLVPNRRPTSSLLFGPDTPVSPFATNAQKRERVAASLMDVSTIGSRSSAALSDTTSTAGLMRTLSSCPPSYTTRPSPPPSYTADTTCGATRPSSACFGYVSSS